MLTLAIGRQTWGQTDAAPDPALYRHIRTDHHDTCHYCGWQAPDLLIQPADGDPQNLTRTNLRLICPVCDTWQHLERLNGDDAVLVYLPEVAPEDISHLMRTLLIALRSDSPIWRKRAERVLHWLTGHRHECEKIWGSSHPGEFARALLQVPPERVPQLQAAFRHLALIVHPGKLTFSPPPLDSADWQTLLTRHPID